MRDRNPEIARVVRQHVVVDAEVEATRVTGAERSPVAADEEDLIAIADAADECGGGTIGKRTIRVEWRIAFARRAIAAIAPPAGFAGGREIDLLTGVDVDFRVDPLLARVHDNLALAHTARRNTSGFVPVVVALSSIELDPIDFFTRDADGSPSAAAAFLELDVTTVHAKQLALQTSAIV